MSQVDYEELSNNPLTREINIRFLPGHRIILPPYDYDSWILGYVIFEPEPDRSLIDQCTEITQKVSFKVDSFNEKQLTGNIKEG